MESLQWLEEKFKMSSFHGIRNHSSEAWFGYSNER